MTVTIRHYSFVSLDSDGERITLGNRDRPNLVSVDGSVVKKQVSVAVSTAVTLFDVSVDGISDFNYLWVASDFDLMLELITDDGNDVGEEVYTVPLIGTGRTNEYGIPFVLGDDTSYANYTVAFGGGTLDAIEQITVKNLSASQVARAVLLAVT